MDRNTEIDERGYKIIIKKIGFVLLWVKGKYEMSE